MRGVPLRDEPGGWSASGRHAIAFQTGEAMQNVTVKLQVGELTVSQTSIQRRCVDQHELHHMVDMCCRAIAASLDEKLAHFPAHAAWWAGASDNTRPVTVKLTIDDYSAEETRDLRALNVDELHDMVDCTAQALDISGPAFAAVEPPPTDWPLVVAHSNGSIEFIRENFEKLAVEQRRRLLIQFLKWALAVLETDKS